MHRLILLSIAVGLTGCASASRSARSTALSQPDYSDATAAALAIDPPLTANEVHPELARGPREPAAYLGYQDSTVESSTSFTDNLENSPYGDSYARESVTIRSNTRYR